MESRYIILFLCCLPSSCGIANSSTLASNYNVTGQATYLVAARVSVHDGVQTRDRPSVGMWSLNDTACGNGLSCSVDHYSEPRVFISHTWHHYYKILNELSDILFTGMTRNQMRKSIWNKHFRSSTNKNEHDRASLVAQWLRIRLPMQGTRVRALVREDPTCCRATKPVSHNY